MSFKKGFTLIELLVVIAIIGILSTILVANMMGTTSDANDVKKQAAIDTLRKAIFAYGIHEGSYPILDCTIGVDCTTLEEGISPKYIATLPTDATYHYVSDDGTNFTISVVLSDSETYSYNSETGFSSAPEQPEYVSTCISGGGLVCTESTLDGDIVYTYTYSSAPGTTTLTIPAGMTWVNVFLVGGGGGGGRGGEGASWGGGGGGGEANFYMFPINESETFNITVGAGGVKGTSRDDRGDNGGISSFGEERSVIGGGGGGSGWYNNSALWSGLDGGGGGGGSHYGGAGGTGVWGGNGAAGLVSPEYGGGGGGIAGSASGYQGGVGVEDPFGISIYGAGGDGYGGSTNAPANTGNGGPSGTKDGQGGNGGSGIVIVRFTNEEPTGV